MRHPARGAARQPGGDRRQVEIGERPTRARRAALPVPREGAA